MTLYLQAILMGILEGLTEFIPVSSTGHLILLGDFLNFDPSLKDTFSIAIQLGAIFRMLFLDSYHKVGLSLVQNRQSILIISVLYLVVGLLLLYLGLR